MRDAPTPAIATETRKVELRQQRQWIAWFASRTSRSSKSSLCRRRIPRNISFVDSLARWNRTFDVYRHGIPSPTLDELFFSEMSIHRFFNHLDATEIHELSIRFQPSIEGHAH